MDMGYRLHIQVEKSGRLSDMLLEFREVIAGDKNLEVIDTKNHGTGGDCPKEGGYR